MVSKYRWVILSLAILAFGSSYLPRMAYPPLIPEMSVALNLTNTEAGMLMSGFWIGYLIMQLPIGGISDKIGTKPIFTIFLTLTGALSILTGFAISYTDCLVYRFANGLAAGCIFAPGTALVLRWYPPSDRAIAIGLFQISTTTGTVLALAFSAVISSIFGSWKWSFWILGIPALIVAMLVLFILKEKPEEGFEGDIDARNGSLSSYYGIVLKDSRVWFLSFAAMGGCTIFIGALTWIPTYLVRFVNLSEVYAGSMTSLIALTGIVSAPFAGFFSDRVLKKKCPVIFFGVIAAGLSCILFSFSMPTALYPALAFFIAILFFSTMWWIYTSLLSEWLPLQVIGTAAGFLNFMTIIGAVISPFIFGYILDQTGSFSLAWLVLGCIATVSALPLLPVMVKE